MAESQKPKRRFAPEPVETTFKTNRNPQPTSTTTTTQTKRFAPVPIETTFESNRKSQGTSKQNTPQSQTPRTGPAPELTPEPSPTNTTAPALHPLQAPVSRERRRFAPQLIETSRRSRRVGDPGPATRPTDKTDITPYTNHIYSAKAKHHRRKHDGGGTIDESPRPFPPPTRRETEDETFKQYLLDLAAKEAERQIQESYLAAFPNSRAREGGVAHFYFREGSDSDDTPEHDAAGEERGRKLARVRRDSSSDVDMGWWQQHMQEHVKQLNDQRQEDDEMDLDDSERGPTDSEIDKMDLSAPPDPMWTTSRKPSYEEADSGIASSRPFGHLQTAQGQDGQTGAFGAQQAPQGGFQQSPFGRPFGGFGLRADPNADALRKAASPPMLGKDLVFRRCPSPKLTKLEPDHPFVQHDQMDKNRDITGQSGLWRGFCYRDTDEDEDNSYGGGPNYMKTPLPGGSPGEPDSAAISEEPTSIFSTSSESSGTAASLWSPNSTSDHRGKPGEAKGLHMLHGIEDRFKRDKVSAEKNEKIAHEFDDVFVTQVYNYLSLGYPSMARSFDEELAKISRMNIDELEKDDEKQLAKGHMLEMSLDETSSTEGAKCPRWNALRIYITEWARQHPDLDNLDPLAWGVRERRGSWAI